MKPMLTQESGSRHRHSLFLVALVTANAFSFPQIAAAQSVLPPRYELREKHDPNGIGKFYMGREIAHVMGHQGADWLERPEREEEEKPGLLLEALKLKPGDAVADIGAGTGYLSWRMAGLVGGKGRVYAVDIQQEMLDLLARKMAERKVTNVIPALGAISDARLPTNAIDLAIMVDVYHEFSHPQEMMESICRALKPGGRLVFVEYREEDPQVPIKRVHKMSEAQVRKEAEAQPLEWIETIKTLPRQHIIIFRKKA
jgi:protein-L-isoaspartate O-methyltransferase